MQLKKKKTTQKIVAKFSAEFQLLSPQQLIKALKGRSSLHWTSNALVQTNAAGWLSARFMGFTTHTASFKSLMQQSRPESQNNLRDLKVKQISDFTSEYEKFPK